MDSRRRRRHHLRLLARLSSLLLVLGSVALAAAASADMPLPIADTVQIKLQALLGTGGAELDLAALGRWRS